MTDLECDDMNFLLFGCMCFYRYSFSIYGYRFNQDKRLMIHEQQQQKKQMRKKTYLEIVISK